MSTSSRFIWVNGRLVEFEKATVHFLTAGLHYGISVFEGIRCYATASGPAILRLDAHVERLLESAYVLGFRRLPYDAAALARAVAETVRANELEDCYVRPVIYLAEGGWNPTLDTGTPHVGIAVWPWREFYGPEARERGVRANVSALTRHHPSGAMTKAKIAGNYAGSVLAKTQALRLGFDEAIMLDPDGCVAECTGENIFLVRLGVVYTPPAASVLDGITRQIVLELARDLGLRVAEQPLSRDWLSWADEVFLCGTAAEIIGVREIDFRPIGTGTTGPITRQLQEAYRAVTRGEHPRSSGWLTWLSAPIEIAPGEAPFEHARPAFLQGPDRHDPTEVGYGHGV